MRTILCDICMHFYNTSIVFTQVEQLSEEIQSLQQQLRVCLRERSKLESKKNTLDNLLSSNLLRRKEQLQQDLEEITMDDNRQQLEMKTAELEHLLVTMEQSRTRAEGMYICICAYFLSHLDAFILM